MENIGFNNPSKITLQDQLSSVLYGASLNWVLLSEDAEIIKTLKDLELDQHAKIVDLVIIDLVPNLSNILIKEIIEKCDSLTIETLAVIDNRQLSYPEVETISDVIFQPIKSNELKLRIGRLIKSSKNNHNKNIIKIDELTINTTNYEIVVAGEKVNLRFKEYELLLLLASNPGRVYDRATLLNQIWGYDYFGGTRTVDVHIRRLRSKIEKDPTNLFIETIWNVGYRFRAITKNTSHESSS